jgi:hypothetical protein
MRGRWTPLSTTPGATSRGVCVCVCVCVCVRACVRTWRAALMCCHASASRTSAHASRIDLTTANHTCAHSLSVILIILLVVEVRPCCRLPVHAMHQASWLAH